MADNLLVGSHKYTSEEYRKNYDLIFGEKDAEEDGTCVEESSEEERTE